MRTHRNLCSHAFGWLFGVPCDVMWSGDALRFQPLHGIETKPKCTKRTPRSALSLIFALLRAETVSKQHFLSKARGTRMVYLKDNPDGVVLVLQGACPGGAAGGWAHALRHRRPHHAGQTARGCRDVIL